MGSRLFYPSLWLDSIVQLTPEMVDAMGAQVLLLDIDNTLTTHGNPRLPEEISGWIERMKKHNVRLFLISNNRKRRVDPFARTLGLEYICNAAKPLTFPLKRALSRLNARKEQVLMVGDQLFTDICCANLAGIRSVLVTPIEPENIPFLKFKRKIEKKVLKGFEKGSFRVR